MTDSSVWDGYAADPAMAPFWRAAEQHRLLIQRCARCGAWQFYPRPFCLACDGDTVEWVAARGVGAVYSVTTVHLATDPALGLSNPYDVAIIALDEGPKLLTNLTTWCPIGAAVELQWRELDGRPPVPVFGPVKRQEGVR